MAINNKVENLKDFYMKRYPSVITDSIWKKMRKMDRDNFLSVPQQTVIEKEKIYQVLSGGLVDSESFARAIASYPQIVRQDTDKINYFIELFSKYNYTKEDFFKALLGCSVILGCKLNKIEKLLQILPSLGIDRSDIIENSQILTCNPEEVRLKYMLSDIIGISKKSFINGNFKQSLDKTFARFKVMQDRRIQRSPNFIYRGEKEFYAVVKDSTAKLVDLYPFTMAEKQKIFEMFAQNHTELALEPLSKEELIL